MKSRFRLSNGSVFVEAPNTPTGREFLRGLRKSRPEFKHQQIKPIIQANPQSVSIGVVHSHTF